jgi:hypothetical protein
MSTLIVRETLDELIKQSVPWDYIAVDNRNPKPPVDGNGRLLPFVSSLYAATESPNSLGSPDERCWRELGSCMALFFVPSNTGTKAVLPVVDAFRNSARGRMWRLPLPAVVLEVERADPMGDYASARWQHSLGDYRILSVVLGYRFDFVD